MQRNRPLQLYAESQNDCTAALMEGSQLSNSRTNAVPHHTQERTTGPRQHQRASDVDVATARYGGGGVGASRLDVSPISFYSDRSSTLAAGAPVTSRSGLDTAAAGSVGVVVQRPAAFYDAPFMRDSIPALLQQLSAAPPASRRSSHQPTQETLADTKTRNANRSSTETRMPSAATQRAATTATAATASAASVQRSAPLTVPRHRDAAAPGNPNASTAGMSSASSRAMPPHSTNNAPQGRRNRSVALLDGEKVQRVEPRRDLLHRGHSSDTALADGRGERGVLRYVVLQAPAAVHGAAYGPPTSSRSTTQTSAEEGSALADSREPIGHESGPSSRRSQLSEPSLDRSVAGQEEQPMNGRYAQPSSREGTNRLAEYERRRTATAVAAGLAAKRDARGRGGVGSGASSRESRPSPSPSPDEARTPVPTATALTDSSSLAEDVSASSARVSSSRMRTLFASILSTSTSQGSQPGHRAGRTSPPLQGSAEHVDLRQTHDDPPSQPSSRGIRAAARHQPHVISSAFASAAGAGAARVAGGVESREASPFALPSPSVTTGRSTKPVAAHSAVPNAFGEAVMEGGDPLVLRHAVEYLLSKARRLERENAELWSETHSWSPHRQRLPDDEAAAAAAGGGGGGVTSAPLPPPSASTPVARPSASRAAASTTTKGSGGRAAGTQTGAVVSAQSTSSLSRVFVRRSRVHQGAGRSASSRDSSASVREPSPPPMLDGSLDAASRTGHLDGGHQRDRGSWVCSSAEGHGSTADRTPRNEHHQSIVVSSPSAVAGVAETQSEVSGYAYPSSPPSLVEGEDADGAADHDDVTHVSRRALTVHRVEAAVQHRSSPRGNTAASQTTRAAPTATEREGDIETSTCSGPPTTTAAAAAAVRTVRGGGSVRSLLSAALRTPTLDSSRLRDAAAVGPDDGAPGTHTPLASTVRSHRSMESRRSVASMTTPQVSLHGSARRAGVQSHSATAARHHHNGHAASSRRSLVEEPVLRAGTDGAFGGRGGQSAVFTTSNASFGSAGRPSTYNKQVQTASIVSPVDEESDSETLIDSAGDAMAATTVSPERTAVIELHTAAAYSRETVLRLRAYCSSLETTRQQLRRRALMSPSSQASSTAGGSRVFSASSRAGSRSGFPLPLANGAMAQPTLAAAAAANGSLSSVLSRPFFASEYADPEVDATLHDVEETPASETMIVLQEDGAGSVTKRVVDGSPTRLSVSPGRSPSPTSAAASQLLLSLPGSRSRVVSHVAHSPALSHNGAEMDRSLASLHSSFRRPSQPFFPGSVLDSGSYAAHTAELQRGDRAVAAHDGRSARVPAVQLSRSSPSPTVTSWLASEHHAGPPSRERTPRQTSPLPLPSSLSLPAHTAGAAPRFGVPLNERASCSAPPLTPTPSPPLAPLPIPRPEGHAPEEASAVEAGDLSGTRSRSRTSNAAGAGSAASQRFAVPGVSVTSRASSSSSGSHARSPSGQNNSTSRSSEPRPDSQPRNEEVMPPLSSPAVQGGPRPPPPPAATGAMVWDPHTVGRSTAAAAAERTPERHASVASRGSPQQQPPPPLRKLSPPSRLSSQASEDDDDCAETDALGSPRELAATSAASSKQAGRHQRLSQRTDSGSSALVPSVDEADTSNPASPSPLLPSDTRRAKAEGYSTRSITVAYRDEAEPHSSPHQIIHARLLRLSASPNSVERREDDVADTGFHSSEDGSHHDDNKEEEVQDPDELCMPASSEMDRDWVVSDREQEQAEHGQVHRPSCLVSPSPPRITSYGDDDGGDTREQENNNMDMLEQSGASSRSRRLTMPLDRPPIAPSRVILVGQDSPSSSSPLSRSLRSFSSSSSDSDEAEEGDERDELH